MIRLIAFVIIMVVAYGIVGTHDFEDAQAEEAHYCEMRRIWESSRDIVPHKRPGWPNFKPEIDCGNK